MLAIIAEEVRKDVRRHLRESTSISLAVDDSDGRKLVRARCDTPSAPYRFDCVMGIVTKKLGARGKVAREVMEDCALSTHEQLQAFHERFFMTGARRFSYGKSKKASPASADARVSQHVASGRVSPGIQPAASSLPRKRQRNEIPQPTLDHGSMEDYRRKVRVLASDGGSGERRALFVTATSQQFPNVHMVIKDMMHCIRIATQKPLHFVEGMEEVFHEIIDKQHALLPDLSNSVKWKKILEAVQEEVLTIPHLTLRGALQYVLTHLAFAKQRMDSCADPLAKVSMMLLPIAVLLSLISSDERNKKEQRIGAAKLLAKFKPKFTHALGVSADWGLISEWFLRLFDSKDHDISNSVDEEEEFAKIFESVFVNGGVFHKTGASACGDAELLPEFMTERVRQQCRQRCVFRCGEKSTVVWGPIEKSDLEALSLETRVAAQTTLARVHADMADGRRHFQCFSLKRIAVAFGQDAARGAAMRGCLLAALRNLGRTFRLDVRMLQLEYEDAIPVMLKLFQEIAPGSRRGTNGMSFPNWSMWNKILDNTFVQRQFPVRMGPFVELVSLIRIWISVLDGESTVERDFAHVRSFVRSGKISNASLIDDLVLVKLSGPQSQCEVASKSACGDLVPSDLTLRCAAQWRYLYGARCGITHAQRKPRPPPVVRKPSWINLKRSVMQAAREVTQKMSDGGKSLCVKTRYGVDSTFFCSHRGEQKHKTRVWNKRLQRFSDLTRSKKSTNELLGKFGRTAFPRWKAICGFKSDKAWPVFGRIAFMPPHDTAACGAVSEARYTEMGYTILRGMHSSRLASIFIIDSLESLHGSCPSKDWVICAVYIVAKGIPVTTAACCDACAGDVRKLPRSNIIEHVPANANTVEFTFQADFKRQHRVVVDAVRNCCQDEDSKWNIRDQKTVERKKCDARGSAPACGGAQRSTVGSTACGSAQTSGVGSPSGGCNAKSKRSERYEVCSLADMWQILQQLRRVRNDRTAPVLWMKDRVGM